MTDLEPSPPPDRGPPGTPRTPIFELSRFITIGIAVVLAGTFLCLPTPRTPSDRIDQLEDPLRTTVRIFERDLELSDAVTAAGPWLRRTLEVVMNWPNDPLVAASEAYGEVYSARIKRNLEYEEEALQDLQVRRAILLAEAGHWDEADRALQTVDDDQPELSDLVRRAYGEPERSAGAAAVDQSATRLREGWVRDRLELRLAERRGDTELVERLRAAQTARSDMWRGRATTLMLLFAVPCVAGLVILCVWLLMNRPTLPVGSATIPPLWSWERGFAILVRAAFVGIAISALLIVAGSALEIEIVGVWTTLIASLPMMWWIRHYLTQPTGLSMSRVFGLLPVSRNALAWIGLMLAVIAVDQLGASVITVAMQALGVQFHWSELAQENLIWGSTPFAMLRFVDGAVWAPIFEEIGCRGLLYMTIRKRLGPSGAALVSASLFGAVHLYSLPGLLSVCWSGIVFAVAVERCKSLVPGMVAHGFNNAIALGGAMMFYR